MVANNDQLARMFKLQTSVADLAMRGKRDPEQIADLLQRVNDNPNFSQELFPSASFGQALPKSQPTQKTLQSQLRDWQSFYLKFFNLNKDFTNLRIPEEKEGLNFLLILAQGLTPSQIYKVMTEHFQCWKYIDNLNTITSDRTSQNGDYAIWLRNSQEADEDLKNLSANDLKAKNIQGITLEERLIMELFYWWKTAKHLDGRNWTLCSGSRGPDGSVPCVYWHGARVRVDWSHPGYRLEGRRCRLVVS